MYNLCLNEFKVLNKEYKENGKLFIYVTAINYHPICPKCKSKSNRIHGNTERKVKDINFKDCEVYLIIEGHRYRCLKCGNVYSESYTEIDFKSRITKRLREQIEKNCFTVPFTIIAKEYGISEATVRKIFYSYVDKCNKERIFSTPAALSIDSIKINNMESIIFTDIDNGLILDVIQDVSKSNVINFINSFSNKKQIKVVLLNIDNTYYADIHTLLPGAKVIIDKCYVINMILNSMENTRKKYKLSLSKTDRNILTHDKELLAKNYDELSLPEINKLNIWFKRYTLLECIYWLKEEFISIYQKESKEKAIKAYMEWKLKISDNLEFFKVTCDTIDHLKEEIFNYTECVNNFHTNSKYDILDSIQEVSKGYTFDIFRSKLLYKTLEAEYIKTSNGFGIPILQLQQVLNKRIKEKK